MKKLLVILLSILPLGGVAVFSAYRGCSRPVSAAGELERLCHELRDKIKRGALSEVRPFVRLTNRRISKSWKSVLGPAATKLHEAFLYLPTEDAPQLRQRFIDSIVEDSRADDYGATGLRAFFGPAYKKWEWSYLVREADEEFDPTKKPAVIHIALPVLAEKVIYEEKPSWLVIANWGIYEDGAIAHVAFFVVEAQTGEVLLTGQCG